MIVKITLLALLLSLSSLFGQVTPPASSAVPVTTNRDELLRKALRRSLEGGTNATAIVQTRTATNATVVPTPAGTVVVPPPVTPVTPPAGTVVPAIPPPVIPGN